MKKYRVKKAFTTPERKLLLVGDVVYVIPSKFGVDIYAGRKFKGEVSLLTRDECLEQLEESDLPF